MPRKPHIPLSIAHLDTREQLGFDVALKRSPRRRTLEIIIRNGVVQLMLPQFVSNGEGMRFLQSKRQWILQTLDKHRVRAQETVAKRYTEGETFDFLGKPYSLRIHTAKRTSVQRVGGSLYVGIASRAGTRRAQAVQKALWQWYRQQAMEILSAKTDALAGKIGRSHAGVRLRRTKTKWGHCTTAGVIQYNWQIMAAPEAVIDYLVAHEVSHLVHCNHGKRFWRHVERLCPDYKELRDWLKLKGHTLVV